jgi:hypothetical protein
MLLVKKTKKINDDGWVLTCVICFCCLLFCLTEVEISYSIVGLLIGICYEQIIEWLAHGWLQHYNCRTFSFFVWRHERHHLTPSLHHALQPIVVFIPVVLLLLSPFMVTAIFFDFLHDFSLWVIIGFLATHIILNIEHYDIHVKKIVPKPLRNSWYYKQIIKYHLGHHISHAKNTNSLRVYGITNPWMDIFFQKIGLSSMMDIIYPKMVKYLDKLFFYDK